MQIGHSTAQKAPIEEVLTTHKFQHGDNGYQSTITDLNTLKRDDSSHLTAHRESVKTLTRQKGPCPTLKEDNSIKDPTSDHKNSHGNGGISFTRDRDTHSTPIADKLSTHRPDKKRSLVFDSRKDDNKHLATLEPDERAEEKTLESTGATFLVVKYKNQT